jgi:hypothetical protein
MLSTGAIAGAGAAAGGGVFGSEGQAIKNGIDASITITNNSFFKSSPRKFV